MIYSVANVIYLRDVRRKTAPDFLAENMIDLDKQFFNPAPKTPAVRGGRREEII
jgi:hypothetical protein